VSTTPGTDPQLFERFAGDYDRFTSLAPPPYAKWLEATLPACGGRALDVGCGSGRLTALLAQRFDEVVGIDISPSLIEIARRKRSAAGIHYELEDVCTFEDGPGFELVFSSTTLHHVPQLSAVLARLRRLVRPQGVAMLIDNVAPGSPVPNWRHVAGALRRFPRDFIRLGGRDAGWLLHFQLSRSWLEHLASDRYLTRSAFEDTYGAVFPGGDFITLGYAHALVWRNQQ
jgi:ubiquinone/menaquinone biosynthesis C-methylase UbiE